MTMAERELPIHHRATDPGGRVWSFGSVTWVHCPECDHAAKSTGSSVSCARCGYATIPSLKPYSDKWAYPTSSNPRCSHCGTPLDRRDRPTARHKEGKLFVSIRCDHCDETEDYPASPGSDPAASRPYRLLRRHLETQVGGETLWVNNLVHLDALEDWLGAKVRERGPQPGLTMMAKLPRWMKASTNRAKVLRGLAQLRERAEQAGIDE